LKRSQPIILINLEKSPSKRNNQNLQHNNQQADNPEKFTSTDTIKEVQFILDSSAADEIEDL
jgi:hypothetical protein